MKIFKRRDFIDYCIDCIPTGSYILVINHQFENFKRYIFYKIGNYDFEIFFDTNTKEAMKIFFDLNGFNIGEKYIIKPDHIGPFKVETEAFELKK